MRTRGCDEGIGGREGGFGVWDGVVMVVLIGLVVYLIGGFDGGMGGLGWGGNDGGRKERSSAQLTRMVLSRTDLPVGSRKGFSEILKQEPDRCNLIFRIN